MKTQYNKTELEKDFKVIGFGYGYCAVENKETKEKGSFDFKDSPVSKNLWERIYFNYQKA